MKRANKLERQIKKVERMEKMLDFMLNNRKVIIGVTSMIICLLIYLTLTFVIAFLIAALFKITLNIKILLIVWFLFCLFCGRFKLESYTRNIKG